MEMYTDYNNMDATIPTIGYLQSNTLVPDTATGTCDTLAAFDTLGNLAVPVGFIDGVPPIGLNGYDPQSGGVDSVVNLVETESRQTGSTGTTEASFSFGLEGEFEKFSGSASYEEAIKRSTTSSNEFSSTITESFALHAQGGGDYAYMVYLAPQFVTQRFREYDYNANPPKSGNATNLYLTYLDSNNPYKYFFQGFNITSPPQSGWLSGALKSPRYDNFNDWNWKTMSGGWHNRDWTQHPQAGTLFNVDKFKQDIEFQNGASQTTSYEMTDSLSNSYEVDKTVKTDATILGFIDVGGSLAFSEESEVTNSLSKGLEFIWEMYLPEGGQCGYKTVVIEPQILTPTGNTGGSLPWVPSTYASFQPWLITYNLVEADKTGACMSSGNDQRVQTAVDPLEGGSVVMQPQSPKKGDKVEVRAVPAPGYTFSHWRAWGIETSHLSSPVIEGTVTSDISTVRAYFVKTESEGIESADIRIDSGPGSGDISISGKIPDELTWAVAMNLNFPFKVVVGNKEYLFGPRVGEREVISSYQIRFTAVDKANKSSYLDLDFASDRWVFSSEGVDNLGASVLGNPTVRLGIAENDFYAVEDLPCIGTETISWTGAEDPIENDLFTFDSDTSIEADLSFNGVKPGSGRFRIEGAKLTSGTISAETPVTLTVNHLKIRFDNATFTGPAENPAITFTRSDSDLTSTLTFQTTSNTWQADLSGERLCHTTWPESIPIGLHIGTSIAKSVIQPQVQADLHFGGEIPVQADFSASPVTGPAPLRVFFTDISTGQWDYWNYNFGDGFTSTEKNPIHEYRSPGTYTVTSKVLKVEGGQLVRSSTIKHGLITVGGEPAGGPRANFTATPRSGPAPLTVVFTDTSTGSPDFWNYDFGDGTSSDVKNPRHEYQNPGNYTVKLTVMKVENGVLVRNATEKQDLITVTGPPQSGLAANFTAAPFSGPAPLKVAFTDTSVGSPDFWNYDFGDGTSSDAKSPQHEYLAPGNYTVNLTVMKVENGVLVRNTTVKQDLITVTGPPQSGLTANFTAAPLSGPAPLKVAFTDTSTGDPDFWGYQFGDGTSSSSNNPVHTYLSPGDYDVTLTVIKIENGKLARNTTVRQDLVTVQ